ncbi:MAG: dihydroorotate dehydrogenase [bacterium]|nr:dihydroorotate dehydrogenase [bacterium]
MKTEISFLGVKFDNPIVLASGILGVTAASMKRCIDLGAGGVTIKSLSMEPREGHVNPTMAGYDNYFLNAVGLSNPGVKEGVKEIIKFKKMCSAPIIGSIFGGSVEEFGETAEIICESPIDILEINISCPNVKEEFGSPYAYDPKAAAAITKKVKEATSKHNIPVSTKLSPNAWNITEIAKACKEAGADAVTAVNTVSGMTIDTSFQTPLLTNKSGGVSGPALKPIAVKAVWDVYDACNMPIIATGGVTSGDDAIEMMLAGGELVGVGSAVFWRGPEVFKIIVDEMKQYMTNNNIDSLASIIGKAHTS